MTVSRLSAVFILMASIEENYHAIQARLAACHGDSVTLIAVAKKFPADTVRAAVAAGIRHVGENYLQEAKEKIAALADLPIVWHFVGGVQKRKAATVARLFDWVHSIDRAETAQRLSAARAGRAPLNVLLQINLSGETSKAGVPADEAAALAAAVAPLPDLRLRGLMTLPAPTPQPDEQYAAFRRLADLQAALRPNFPTMDSLSMGMSGDFEQAIRAGATHIRVGEALFGARPKK